MDVLTWQTGTMELWTWAVNHAHLLYWLAGLLFLASSVLALAALLYLLLRTDLLALMRRSLRKTSGGTSTRSGSSSRPTLARITPIRNSTDVSGSSNWSELEMWNWIYSAWKEKWDTIIHPDGKYHNARPDSVDRARAQANRVASGNTSGGKRG